MLVTVGVISRAHGVRGEVAVDVRTDSPEQRFTHGAVLATEPTQAGPLTIARTRWHSGRLLVQFSGVLDRTAAEALRGVRLQADVDEQERPDDPDEYYDHQLTGLSVRTSDGTVVGEVAEVIHLPGQDLLAVHQADGGEALIPFVAAIVPTVDIDAGEIVIDPPPGLLSGAPDGTTP
ncbi:MAG TPA: ribosome maturation factor RimM [Jiangellaceae bacterium]|nr:ribosome maturation factor RimM [Jiangellaceae bacterium]